MAWTREDAAHLLRRAGFGGSYWDVDNLFAKGRSGAVDCLLNYQVVRDPAWDSPDPLGLDHSATNGWEAMMTLLYRFLVSSRPLHARLTLFWNAYWNSAAPTTRARVTAGQANSLSWYASENFQEFKVAINKNGAGILEPESRAFLDRARCFASGDVMPRLSETEETTRCICSELYRHFVSERANPIELDNLVNVWRLSGGNLKAVIGALLKSRAFWDVNVRGTLAKSSLEYVAGLLQRLGHSLDRELVENTAWHLRQMGQASDSTPSPAGHEANQLRASEASLLESRYRFAHYVIYEVDADEVAARMTAGSPNRILPNAFITFLSQRLGMTTLTTATRNALNEYLGTGAIVGEAKREKALGVIYRLACCPEYQLS